MEKLLTRDDLAKLFQVSQTTIIEWEGKGVIRRLPNLPGHPRYSPKQIALLADMDLDAFSPFLLRKLEKENAELKQKNARLENQLSTINQIINGGKKQ